MENANQATDFACGLRGVNYLNYDSLENPLQRMPFQKHLETTLERDLKQEESEARQKVKEYIDPNVVEYDEIIDRVGKFPDSIHAKGVLTSASNFRPNDIPQSFDESLQKEFEAAQKRVDQFRQLSCN
ncbi:hypothetical protein K7432_006617 [Basidiobolus ranarum]|uniref:Uncharacterized protein n=1 Tax=Basidiobolus ranarum TaxID=34480 RepID=A0ABR2WUP9_9FUNG